MSEPITFLAVAATDRRDREGDRLSFGAIRSLQEQINRKPCPLSWKFDPSRLIGSVTRAQVTTRGLEVTGEIDPRTVPEGSGPYYVALGFRSLEADYTADGGSRTIEELELIIFGLTDSSTDPNVEPLELTTEEDIHIRWGLSRLQDAFVREAERILEHFRALHRTFRRE